MILFSKRYTAFISGFVITAVLAFILYYSGFLLIDADEYEVGILLFVFWWLMISLPIYKFSWLKKHRNFLFKLLGLAFFLIATLVLDNYLQIPDNPISILCLELLCAGILYLIAPKFVMKYRILILGFYSIVFCYFLVIRLLLYTTPAYVGYKDFFIQMFAISAPMIIGIWVYEQWKWLKNLQAEKATAELAMLKSQVNPHFFFNTLNNLHALTIQHSDKAPEVIIKLSEMMRYTIYEGEKERVLLEDEIEYLENYIALHKIRHHKSVVIDFEHAVEGPVDIAPMLLVVLLENAFKHGVDQLTETAFIKMNLLASAEKISFTIENNFDPSEEKDPPGIGLENLKRRLSLIYPGRHEFSNNEKADLYRAELTILSESNT